MTNQFEFSLKWRTKLTQYVITHPLLKSRNLAFVCTKPVDNLGANSSIFAFAAGTGGLVWEYTFENTSISGMCLYESPQSKKQLCILSLTSNDFLYGSGEVVAFNPAGEIEWRIKLSDKTVSAPIVHNGRLFVTDGGDSLTAIDPENQKVLFEHSFIEVKSSLSAIAINHNHAFIPCRSANLIAQDLKTGQIAWKFSIADIDQKATREWLDKTPLVDGNTIFTTSTKGRIVSLDQESGSVVWHKEIEPNAQLTPPANGKQSIFVGGKTGIFAINKNDGKLLWKHSTARRVSAQPQVAGDLLFATCEDHFVYVLHTQTGEKIASFEMDRRIEIPILLSPDSIYVVDRAAELKVFKFTPAQANLQVPAPKIMNTAEEAKRLVKAGQWLKAVKIFEILDDFPARANALEEYAIFISTSSASDHDKALAWEKAADAYTESGESEKKQVCKIEIARHRRHPLFDLQLKETVFTLESWSKLEYTLKNTGFGLARFVGVIVSPETVLFDWRNSSNLTSFSVQKEMGLTGAFTIRPLNTGNEVPLELLIEYMDVHDKRQVIPKSFSVSVMRNQDEADRLILERKFDGRGIAKTPIELRNIIVDTFNRSELDDIMFEMNFNSDNFPGPINTAARNFINTVLRRNMTDQLLDIIEKERPSLASK